MKVTYRLIFLLLAFTAISCGTNKRVSGTQSGQKDQKIDDRVRVVVEEVTAPHPDREVLQAPKPGKNVDKVAAYIDRFAHIAQEEMALYKIPASITLAQGILESGAGHGELTLKANNHFGIKCHGWEGGGVYHDDDRPQECFRKYKDAKYSYRDHSLFLAERKRYAGLFDLEIDDYVGWAKGLKAAGYATDPKYPDKLISIIERYQLYQYDGEVIGKQLLAHNERPKKETGPQTVSEQYVVKQGDTLYSIARRYNLTVDQLKQYNNLRDNAIGIGQILYVTP